MPEDATTRILELWPDAVEVRGPERCPACRREGLLSFLLTDWPYEQHVSKHDGVLRERCGFWCEKCGWSISGSRPVE